MVKLNSEKWKKYALMMKIFASDPPLLYFGCSWFTFKKILLELKSIDCYFVIRPFITNTYIFFLDK